MSLVDDLVAAAQAKRKPQRLDLEELGLAVWVRTLSASDALALMVRFQELTPAEDQAGKERLARERAAISLAAFLCDEQGVKVAELSEAHRLIAELPIAAINQIVEAGQKLNAMTESAEAREKN